MRLTTLSDNTLLLEQYMNDSRKILRESCKGLTRDQETIVEGIYNEFVPLIEATLTAQQIQQIFGDVETNTSAAGGNRTLLGKGVDVTKKANEIINNVGKWLQDTTPVKMADQKFEQLKSSIGSKFPQLDQQLTAFGGWMKENPGKSAAVIGVLTAIASLAAGPVGGAVAGQVLKGAQELIKGSKLSTAVGKGAKAAALGWLTGKAVEALGDIISKPIQMVADKMDPGLAQANFVRTINEIGGKFGNRFEVFDTGPLVGRPEDVKDILTVYKDAVSSWEAGDYMRANSMFQSAAEMTAKIDSNEYMIQLALDTAKSQEVRDAAKNTASFFSQMAGVAQGAATGATSNEKKESYYVQNRPLSEGQVYMVFSRVETLTEGPLDALKGFAAKGVAKAQQVGHNLTTKITADKLSKAWQSAGSPTDSDKLADFLHDQGVEDAIVDQIYAKMKIQSGEQQPKVDIKQVQQMVAALPTDRKIRLLTYLQKSAATTAPAQPKKAPV